MSISFLGEFQRVISLMWMFFVQVKIAIILM